MPAQCCHLKIPAIPRREEGKYNGNPRGIIREHMKRTICHAVILQIRNNSKISSPRPASVKTKREKKILSSHFDSLRRPKGWTPQREVSRVCQVHLHASERASAGVLLKQHVQLHEREALWLGQSVVAPDPRQRRRTRP